MTLGGREASRKYRERHPDRVKEAQRRYRENNPEKAKEKSLARKNRPGAQEKANAYERNRRRKNRLKAIAALGGCCLHCGILDDRVLQFDHKTPVKRREKGTRNYGGYLSSEEWHAIVEGREHDIQLFCANCHVIKTRADQARNWLGETK